MVDRRRDPDLDILLKAFENTRAWSALIVTLSTGGIVFTAIFRRDFAPTGQELQNTSLLLATWIVLGVATLFGVFYLSVLTALLNRGRAEDLDLYAWMPRFIAIVQLATFLTGLGLLLAFAAVNLS